MPLIVARGVSTSGWSRNEHGTWISHDPIEVEKMRAALAADREACNCVHNDSPVKHNTGYVGEDMNGFPTAYTYQCRSRSRWFNPQTGQMEGHSHCTCDYCF